jgi:hypothetical protein
MPKHALRLVDPETGEITEHACPNCAGKDETITTLGNKISSLKGRITELLQEAEEGHEAFPNFRKCHEYWRERCRHPRTEYDLVDFKLWLPLYQKHGLEKCQRAIDGAAYDPYVSTRKNGAPHRHNEWELIHREGGHKFREFVNKAPYQLPKPEHLSIVSKALMWRHPDWDYPQVTAEAKLKVRRWAL